MAPPQSPSLWRSLLEAAKRSPLVGAWRRHPRRSLYLASIALHLALAPFLVHDWDGYVFVTTTRDFLAGTTPYETVEDRPPRIFVGEGVPVVNSWYAYPPLPLLLWTPFYAALAALAPVPALERLAIKLPAIAGDLLLAFLAATLVRELLAGRGLAQADRAAAWTERALLLNPLLLFMSGVWGMFDSWILALLLGAVLLWRRGRFALAGASFGAAAMVKLFPIFVGPAFIAYALRTRGLRPTLAAAAGGTGVVAALCLPFYLAAPHGFLEQTLLMHSARPPQGFTLVGLPLGFEWTNNLLGLRLLPEGTTPEMVSRISFLLLATLLALLYARVDRVDDERALIHTALLAMLLVLLTGKVVIEQYFILPAVLATVAFALSAAPLHRRIAQAYSWGGFAAAVVAGWHFLTFIPPDVAVRLPFDVAAVLPALRSATGLTDFHLYLLPALLSSAAMVPALLISLRLVVPALAAPLADGLARLQIRPPLRRPALAVLFAAVLVLPAAAGALSAPGAEGAGALPPRAAPPYVVMSYDLGWLNPAHDPATPWGTWRRGVSDVPLLGYYSESSGKIDHDFRVLREAGVDVILFDAWYHVGAKLPALSRLARSHGLLVAPSVNLTELALLAGLRATDALGSPAEPSLAMRAESRMAVVDLAGFFLDPLQAGGATWRVEGRPVVVLHGTALLRHDAGGAERERLIDLAVRLGTARADLAPQPVDRSALAAAFPLTEEDLAATAPWSALWRATLSEARLSFWREVRSGIEARHGPVFLVATDPWSGLPPGSSPLEAIAGLSIFDSSYERPPGSAWRAGISPEEGWARWSAGLAAQEAYLRGAGRPVFAPVFAGYDNRAFHGGVGLLVEPGPAHDTLYGRGWRAALAAGADAIILHSWNEYDEGLALEPSRSRGATLLAATAAWVRELRAAPAVPHSGVLLVTDLLGAREAPGSPYPDLAHSLTLALTALGPAPWGGRVDAADLNQPGLTVNLSRYRMVVVDPGGGLARTAPAADLLLALDSHVRAGAGLLVLGAGSGEFQALGGWQEGAPLTGPTWLLLNGTEVPIETTDRTRVVTPPGGAQVVLKLRNETRETPALWHKPLGNGSLAATSFRPQGTNPPDAADLAVLRAVLEALR